MILECVDGFYNRGCSGTCGSCVNGQFCEKIYGHCTNGCKANYQQPMCKGIWSNVILIWRIVAKDLMYILYFAVLCL